MFRRTLPTDVVSALSIQTARLFLGKSFTSALDAMERGQWGSQPEVAERVNVRLAALLDHARATVPFYRSNVGPKARPNAEIAHVDLAGFPVVTKRDLRAAGKDQLLSEHLPIDRRLERSTSGSTGEPFRFFLDRAALPVIFASHVFYDRWCGLGLGERYFRLAAPIAAPSNPGPGASPAFRLRQQLIRHLRGAYEHHTQRQAWLEEITPETADGFRRQVEAFQPAFILGYTSTLAAVAAELLRSNQHLASSVRGVITIAELLTPERRRLIEQYYQAPITNRYGLREFGSWSGQSCSTSADRIHFNSELVVWEILAKDGSPVKAGEVGRLILTDLHNLAMPFIRYDTGDLAVAEPGLCPCGRTFPLLTIEGRSYECLRTRSGEVVTPLRLSLVLSPYIDSDQQYQLVQEAPDRVRLTLTPGPRIDDLMSLQLRRALETVVGKDVQIEVDTVDRNLPDSSGKRPTIKHGALVQ